MRVVLLGIAMLTLAGCNSDLFLESVHFGYVRTVNDERPPLNFDPAQPFVLEFGRGSGMHGLNTIKLDESRTVTIHRDENVAWETASFKLTQNEFDAVLNLVEKHRLLGLKRAYHLEGMHDGTQWVFCLKQGSRRKSIYFNNTFPDEIANFATALDKLLSVPARTLQWTKVSGEEIGRHDAECWNCIEDQGKP